jgi:hypothetical protein
MDVKMNLREVEDPMEKHSSAKNLESGYASGLSTGMFHRTFRISLSKNLRCFASSIGREPMFFHSFLSSVPIICRL